MAEKNTTENKHFPAARPNFWLQILPEIACMLLVAACLGGYAYVTGAWEKRADELLSGTVLVIFGIAALGFVWRRCGLRALLDYDNASHPRRFWMAFAFSLLLGFVCGFLPERTWPLMPVFVLLTLLGNLPAGVLGGATVVLLPVMMTGASASAFAMYLIAGILGAVLFLHPDDGKELRTVQPLVLSLCGLLVCVTAGSILPDNAHPDAEDLLFPLVNAILSGILIFAILKAFSDRIIYRYRLTYLEWNDSENAVMSARKAEDKATYMKTIHVAYFCERIAGRLGLDGDAIKCAAYYAHIYDPQAGKLPEKLNGKYDFPPQALAILEQFHSNGKHVRSRETCVLIASELVVSAIMKGTGTEGFDAVSTIDKVFEKIEHSGIFHASELSFGEYEQMKKIFREEKLYYDFIR